MTVRFRIRTSQGQELSFASHEMFEEFVRSGDLAPDDLVYDGDAGEWAPGRTHPLVLEIEYEKEEAESAESAKADDSAKAGGDAPPTKSLEDFGLSLTESEGKADGDAPDGAADGVADGGDPDDDLGLGLALAPMPEAPSPEEENKAFLEKMASERASSLDFAVDVPSASIQGFKMEDPSVMAEMVKAEPEPEPEPEPTREAQERPARIKVARPRPKRASAGKKAATGLIALGVIGGGAYVAVGALASPEQVEGTDSLAVPVEPRPDPTPPGPAPVIASTEEAVRARAQERFLSATGALLDSLPPIPAEWLQGEYFLLPSEHAEIRDIWQTYRATIRDVRAGDEARYRRAYERALDDAGVVDEEERTRRLSGATGDFGEKVPDIDAHWDRVEALALAAVQSHDALLGAEGLVLYDATGSTGRPSGIGAGTSGRDSDSQLLLDQVIDLLDRTLDSDGMGPREGPNVREWVWGGFLDVITR